MGPRQPLTQTNPFLAKLLGLADPQEQQSPNIPMAPKVAPAVQGIPSEGPMPSAPQSPPLDPMAIKPPSAPDAPQDAPPDDGSTDPTPAAPKVRDANLFSPAAMQGRLDRVDNLRDAASGMELTGDDMKDQGYLSAGSNLAQAVSSGLDKAGTTAFGGPVKPPDNSAARETLQNLVKDRQAQLAQRQAISEKLRGQADKVEDSVVKQQEYQGREAERVRNDNLVTLTRAALVKAAENKTDAGVTNTNTKVSSNEKIAGQKDQFGRDKDSADNATKLKIAEIRANASRMGLSLKENSQTGKFINGYTSYWTKSVHPLEEAANGLQELVDNPGNQAEQATKAIKLTKGAMGGAGRITQQEIQSVGSGAMSVWRKWQAKGDAMFEGETPEAIQADIAGLAQIARTHAAYVDHQYANKVAGQAAQSGYVNGIRDPQMLYSFIRPEKDFATGGDFNPDTADGHTAPVAPAPAPGQPALRPAPQGPSPAPAAAPPKVGLPKPVPGATPPQKGADGKWRTQKKGPDGVLHEYTWTGQNWQ